MEQSSQGPSKMTLASFTNSPENVIKMDSVFLRIAAHRQASSHSEPQPQPTRHQGPILLTWFNFNPSMDK